MTGSVVTYASRAPITRDEYQWPRYVRSLYHFHPSLLIITKQIQPSTKKVTLYGQARRTPSDTRLEKSNWNHASQRAHLHSTRRFCAPECRSPAKPIHSPPCLKFWFRIKRLAPRTTPAVLFMIPPAFPRQLSLPITSLDSSGQKLLRLRRWFGYPF
jgi:hypothetical protein